MEPEEAPVDDAGAARSHPSIGTFELRRVRLVGNRVLQEKALRSVIEPFVGRRVGPVELEALREVVTRAYVDRGYVTSGALIPDQDLADGELVLEIVEGRLEEIRVAGLLRLHPGYVRDRLWPDRDAVVHVGRLSERLSLLQADSDIDAVEAELRPGTRPGASILLVRVREGRPWTLALEANNQRSPRIGAYTGEARSSLRNLVGVGDSLFARFQASEGLLDFEAAGELPVHARGPRLGLRARYSESEIVEDPFDALDIESDFLSVGVALTQTLYETLEDRIGLGVIFEWRRGRTRLLGSGFSFAEGVDDGESIVAPLRLEADWTRRQRGRVVALRSLLSVGLPVLDATDLDGAEADAVFVAWIFQAQLAERFPGLFGSELLARADLQLADSPLLPSEQFSIGGHAVTRGFRENQVVRDEGLALSLEWRVPVWARPDGRPIVQIAPFVDWARAFEHEDRENRNSETLAAAGLGLRAFPSDQTRAVLYWGQRITKADRPRKDKDPQDYGIHFALTVELP